MFKYFFVEFYNFHNGDLEHNAVVRSFEEMAEMCQGRVHRIMGPATHEDYIADVVSRA